MDFGYHNPDPQLENRVAALTTWHSELDRDLMAALEGLSDDETADRRIVRSDYDVDDFAPLPTVHLDIYREALLIFYGKFSVYAQALGMTLPRQWQEWIG